MKQKVTIAIMAILVVIGMMLAFNGAIHALFYIFDDRPWFSGLRVINWLSLFLGVTFVLIGMMVLPRPERKRAVA